MTPYKTVPNVRFWYWSFGRFFVDFLPDSLPKYTKNESVAHGLHHTLSTGNSDCKRYESNDNVECHYCNYTAEDLDQCVDKSYDGLLEMLG